ncbi:MAG: S8 family serine peptidase, partial [Gammaproteobacteria bacterium]
DGVDIINYSVGSLETDLTAPDDLALLDAFDAGILTVVAAGNDGPDYATIGSPSSAPWVLTVGASTQGGTRFEEAIEITAPSDLARRIPMREAGFTPRLSSTRAIEAAVVLVDDGVDTTPMGGQGSVRDACEPIANADDLEGAIALIERGQCDFDVKLRHAEEAGAVAAVVYDNGNGLVSMHGERGSVDIPAVMITAADGQRIADRVVAGDEVEVRLIAGLLLESNARGKVVADFSSRGPNLSEADFLKPDLTAPGVEILGGNTPVAANGLRGELFQYMSGTSMSAPEAAGVAALLKEAHPDWSPAAIKSALMTTATRDVVRPGGESLADPFEVGAGHIAPNAAIDPGLVYDSDIFDHAAFLCGLRYSPYPEEDCELLASAGYSLEPRDLNLPSIGVSRLISGDTVTRRVTNVGPPGTYRAEVTAPPGLEIRVEPPTLSLGTNESASFTVTFDRLGAPRDLWTFGELVWTDGERRVASPIAVVPVTLRAPEDVYLTGGAGFFEMPIAFGYTGEYAAGVHGLRAPLVEPGFVEEDETNRFSFRFDSGVTAHTIEMPPNQIFARFALFDDETDGEDDLDLYLFHCPNNNCVQVAESGGFTSEERIDLVFPEPGLYAVLVHGFDTDPAGGRGAHYNLFAWSLGVEDYVGNLDISAPLHVTEGEHSALELEWGGLAPATRYLGAISHYPELEPYSLTVIEITSP